MPRMTTVTAKGVADAILRASGSIADEVDVRVDQGRSEADYEAPGDGTAGVRFWFANGQVVEVIVRVLA